MLEFHHGVRTRFFAHARKVGLATFNVVCTQTHHQLYQVEVFVLFTSFDTDHWPIRPLGDVFRNQALVLCVLELRLQNIMAE